MISTSPEETKRIAANLAATLQGGEVIALVGGLGAGKTTFVQGLCEALGVASRVTSPTFSIMNVHDAGMRECGKALRIAHLDLYRLKTAREIAALGLEEFLGASDTVVAIEWPEAVDGVEWKPTHTVRFDAISPEERNIRIEYGNERRILSADPADGARAQT